MPDITVQFEFGSEGSLSKSVTGIINSEIGKIQSGILDKPLMLKFDIDPSSLSSIKSKITEMANELGTSFGGTFGGSGSSPVAGAKRMAEATRNTTTAIQKQIESLVGLDKKSKSAERSAIAMEKAWLKQREQAAKQEAKAIQKAEKEAQKARENAEKNDFTKNLKSQGDAIQAISTQYTKAQNALRNYTAAEKSNNESARNAYKSIGEISEAFDILQNKVKNGKTSYEEYSQEFSQLKGKFSEQVGIIKEAGLAHKSFGDTLVSTAKKFGQYFTATRLVMGAYRTMKQMVKETIAVNDAMTQLQIVTKSSNQEMASYSQTAFNTAKRLGTSVTDVISATTTYARLGYNTQDSSVLSELTTMLQSVGDIDASSAQSAVTAIVKAFDGIDVTNISSAMDKLVAVGNGAPISVSELAEGLNNASSALSAAGNSFDESVALLTSANTTIQDASKSSTGLRTIAARIRNTKTELDALGETVTDAEYNNIVETLTNITLADGSKVKVSLKDANGELRSTYDIIKDIASVWKYMGDNEQAALAETLAGTRQQNIFYSLVENFDEASNAMDLMSGSMGAMQSAYDIFLTSTTAHINQFKAAFSELSTDFIDTGLMNLFIDFGRILVEVADGAVNLTKVFGPLSSIVTAFAGYKVVSVIKSFA